jgi:protoporphyrinogen oxidase
MRPLKNTCEVAVIGGGLAGLSAARHAARLGRLVTLFEGSAMFGGLVATVDEVDGIPVPGKFSGQDLAMHLLEDARKVGVRIVQGGAAKIALDGRLTLTDQESTLIIPRRSSLPPARRCETRRAARRNSSAEGYRAAQRATVDFSAARMSSWWAAATGPSRRLSCSPRPAGASSWCAAAL